MYFAHGWYLVKTEEPLVRQDFEAWEHGPVIKVIRDAFKKFGKTPITDRAYKLDIFSGEETVVESDLTDEDAAFVRSILDTYQVYHAWRLSEMTHEAGSPWDKIWNASEPIGRLGLRLTNAEIKAHFDKLPRRLRLS